MPSVSDLLLEKKRYDLPEKITIIEKFKLKLGFPVQKIIGYIEMSDVKISVKKKVLIPRYETEELIEIAKNLILKNKYINILDMCSGSGFIGIAIKKWNPDLKVLCVDIDKKAISQSKINANINKTNIEILKSDLFKKVLGKFDLIISNPPYINKNEKKNMDKSVLWFEPKRALFAPKDEMFFYKEIQNQTTNHINKNGSLLFEINPKNKIFFEKNNYEIIRDINKKTRFCILKF